MKSFKIGEYWQSYKQERDFTCTLRALLKDEECARDNIGHHVSIRKRNDISSALSKHLRLTGKIRLPTHSQYYENYTVRRWLNAKLTAVSISVKTNDYKYSVIINTQCTNYKLSLHILAIEYIKLTINSPGHWTKHLTRTTPSKCCMSMYNNYNQAHTDSRRNTPGRSYDAFR